MEIGQNSQAVSGRGWGILVVELQTSIGLFNRPVVKLYPLELGSTVEPEDTEENEIPSQRPSRKTAIAAAQARRRLVETGHL